MLATSFNADVSKWDVSKVMNLQSTFGHAEVFKADVSKWEVSRVTRMSHCKSCFLLSLMHFTLTHPLSAVFSSTNAFNSDVSKWDIAQVESFDRMFFNAIRFNLKSSLEESWSDNSNFPGDSMFNGTCSEDRESGGTCGICGDVSSADGAHIVACGSHQGDSSH